MEVVLHTMTHLHTYPPLLSQSCVLWYTVKRTPLSSPNPAYYDPLLNLPHSPLPILRTMIHC